MTDRFRSSTQSPPARLLPLLPARRTVYRWTCWTVGRHHPSAPGTLLPLLRGRVPVHLYLHYVWQRLANSFPGGCQYWRPVQGLRCVVPLHVQRAEELMSILDDR